MALAALRKRMMMPDGSLVPWRSPGGKKMRIAAAAPEIPWTDLANSLMPNGATLDYVADAPYGERIGVMKQTFVTGLYASGLVAGNYAAPLSDPDADLTTWFTLINAGEPYDSNPVMAEILDKIRRFHSSYYIDDSIAPAPLLISNGWTDDIFPVDEAVRFYNRTRTRHPRAAISMFHFDHGHQRGQNKQADTEQLDRRQNKWFAYFLKGKGRKPFAGVEVLTQTCPKDAPSAGPFAAPNWAEIARGEIRLSDPAERTVAPQTANDAGPAFDPIAGDNACAAPPESDPDGSVSYEFDPIAGKGLTMIGSPTLIAEISSPGPHSQLAARLVDIAPDGTQALVARGLFRPAPGETKKQVFQLHPNAYRFAPGHVAELELLPADFPYGRPTNAQQAVTLADVEIRLPVRQRPGSADGVRRAAPKFVPEGMKLARDFRRAAKR